MPKRRARRAQSTDDDEDLIVTSEEDSSEENEASASFTEEEDEPLSIRRQRRQSTRTPTSAAKRRLAAKRKAFKTIQTARRKTPVTRKRRGKTRRPTKYPSDDDDEEEQDPSSEKQIEDSTSDSPSRSPPPKRSSGLRALRTIGAKPSQLVTGHRDYASERSYESEGLSDFIASENESGDGAASDAADESEDEIKEDEEEEKPVGKRKRKKEGIKGKNGEDHRAKASTIQEKRKSGNENSVAQGKKNAGNRDNNNQGISDLNDSIEDLEDEEKDDDGFTNPQPISQKRPRRALPATRLIISSSDEEDDDAILLAAAGKAAGAAAENEPKRRRLRKGKDAPNSIRNTQSSNAAKPQGQPFTAIIVDSDDDIPQVVHSLRAVEAKLQEDGINEKNTPSKGLRKRPEKPQMTAAERIALNQAKFKTQAEGVKQVDSDGNSDGEVSLMTDEGDLSTSESDGIIEEESEEEREGGYLQGFDLHSDDDDEEEEKGALRKAIRSPGWQRYVCNKYNSNDMIIFFGYQFSCCTLFGENSSGVCFKYIYSIGNWYR